MTDDPVKYQWQHRRIGERGWQNMPDPHPNSPIAGIRDVLINGGRFDDGMGNLYRIERVTS